MTKVRARFRRYAYATAFILIASCGHDKGQARYLPSWHGQQDIKSSDIPWLPSQKSNQTHNLFSTLPDFASDIDKQEMNGLSQNNIVSETDVWVNIVASMPYAMPFYCDPVCYEPSIILALQDCQPYIFALFYYMQNPSLWLKNDDDDDGWIPQFPDNGRGYYFRPSERKGYCFGR